MGSALLVLSWSRNRWKSNVGSVDFDGVLPLPLVRLGVSSAVALACCFTMDAKVVGLGTTSAPYRFTSFLVPWRESDLAIFANTGKTVVNELALEGPSADISTEVVCLCRRGGGGGPSTSCDSSLAGAFGGGGWLSAVAHASRASFSSLSTSGSNSDNTFGSNAGGVVARSNTGVAGGGGAASSSFDIGSGVGDAAFDAHGFSGVASSDIFSFVSSFDSSCSGVVMVKFKRS